MMLKGIVKPNGEIVSMDAITWQLKGAATQLFKAGLLCCVNEKDEMVICMNGNEVPVKIQGSGPKIGQGNNGEVPSKEEEKQAEPQGQQPWEQDFEDQEVPAESEGPQPAEPTRSPNEPEPGAIKPFALPEKRVSRKQARLDAEP